MARAGYKSLLFFNNDLDIDNRYKAAEKIRVVQVFLGFSFFIYHSIIFFGLSNTILFFISSFIISLLLEILGTNKGLIFGKYSYEPSLCPGPMIRSVPIFIAISWTGLIYMALVCTMMIIDGTVGSTINLSHILLTALLVTILDLVLDPIAVDEGRWSWDMPGKYYGVPIKNFIGWFFNSILILLLFSMISSSHVITNPYLKYIEFAPGILFVILPAIAARPCFERNLNIAGILGLLFTIILVTMSYHNFI
jgi:putative membrane protein